jgi:hypothetical protein
MRRVILAGAIAAASVLGTGANAATFDFAAMADNFFANNTATTASGATKKYEADFAQLQASTTGSQLSSGGVTITNASGSYPYGSAHAFFDSSNAGLGVCHSGYTTRASSLGGNVSNCSTNFGGATSDDNLTISETLFLTFDKVVKFTDLVIRDANHNLITANSAIFIGGVGFDAVGGVVQGLSALLASNSFTFATNARGVPQIYLTSASVSAVPLPAAGLLLLGGLAGLGVAGRRRKA